MNDQLKKSLCAILIALLVGAGSWAGEGDSTDDKTPQLELWNDPAFKKDFVQSFGIQSGLEPEIDDTQIEMLQAVRELLLDDNPAKREEAISLLLASCRETEETPEERKLRRKREKKEKAAAAKQAKADAKKSEADDSDAGEDGEASATSAADDSAESAATELTPALSSTLDLCSPTVNFTLGNIYFMSERLDEAIPAYRAAISLFPGYLRANKNLGLIFVRKGNFEQAIEPLSQVIQSGGGDGLTFGLLGYAYSSTGQYSSAESAYRRARLLQPETLDWKLGLTQSVLKQQKYAEAVSLCEELINEFPDRGDYWMLQANAYIGLGQPLKAAENFEILARMDKATPAALRTLGDIYLNEELMDLAVRSYGLAMEGNVSDSLRRTMLQRVEFFTQRGALRQAQQMITSIKEKAKPATDSDDYKQLLKLEARLSVADGQGGDAVGVLEEIVALDPLDGEALMLLGQHYARVQEPEQAIFYYERAESIEKFEADAKVRHAQLLVEESRYSEAVPLLKRAQQIKPREDVARYLEQVERVARSRRSSDAGS